jgi:hypothetical protein
MKITFFRDIAQCSFVEVDRHFRGVYCLHRQVVNVASSSNVREATMFMLLVVRNEKYINTRDSLQLYDVDKKPSAGSDVFTEG